MQCKSEPSPLARGTLSPFIYRRKAHRFIPACAGNSTASTRTVLMSAVHPRLRGELTKACTPMGVWNGSSPLARGTLKISIRPFKNLRFIPACAGNSDAVTVANCTKTGSSPLARGTHLKWLQHYTNRLTAKLLKNISKQE